MSNRGPDPDIGLHIIPLYNGIKPNIIKNKSKILSSYGLDQDPIIRRLDLDRGTIKRYFSRKKNLARGEIVEISERQSIRLSSIPLYQIIEIEWRIRGRLEDDYPPEDMANKPVRLYTGVVTANSITIEEANREMPGIKNKLRDPLQYYQGQ